MSLSLSGCVGARERSLSLFYQFNLFLDRTERKTQPLNRIRLFESKTMIRRFQHHKSTNSPFFHLFTHLQIAIFGFLLMLSVL